MLLDRDRGVLIEDMCLSYTVNFGISLRFDCMEYRFTVGSKDLITIDNVDNPYLLN